MPQNSTYYSDLQIPTVNQDGSTWGTITNNFLNGLLIKLKNLSDRVDVAQSQLTNINRGTNAIDRINTTLAGAIGTNAILSTGSWTTLYPDPYSGSYTKTTSWPAYASDLTSFSPPTTQSEIENFNYEGFAEVLQGKLDVLEGLVDQAEADVLAAQIDTCRTSKILDAIDGGIQTTTTSYTLYIWAKQTVEDYGACSGTQGSPYYRYRQGTQEFENNFSFAPWNGQRVYVNASAIPATSGTYYLLSGSISASANYFTVCTESGRLTTPLTVSINYSNYQVSAPSPASTFTFSIITKGLAVPDLDSCSSPSPPYFI
jgi:hypothetical protein